MCEILPILEKLVSSLMLMDIHMPFTRRGSNREGKHQESTASIISDDVVNIPSFERKFSPSSMYTSFDLSRPDCPR